MSQWLRGPWDWFYALQAAPRRLKQLGLAALDVSILPLLLWAASSLRFGEFLAYTESFSRDLWLALTFVFVGLICRVYSAVVRIYDQHYLQSILLTVTGWVVLAWLCSEWLQPVLPRSVLLVTAFLAMLHLWVSRFLIRTVVVGLFAEAARPHDVLIYGAGDAGRQLAAAIQGMENRRLVAFVDDDPLLQGGRIFGVPVLSPVALKKQALRGLDEIIVAMPSVSRARRREIVGRIESAMSGFRVQVRMLPGLDQVVSGTISWSDLREINIVDLLGRDPMAPDLALFAHHIVDRVVMVTGAAGSIGSELCRQILSAKPAALILLDHSEYGLYVIEQELRSQASTDTLVPVLGSVMDQARMERLMRHHGVETVYHAAAYKHVPLVESNPFEGIKNNVLGTWRTALAARDAGVESFVLISTDKAVRPTNVMGASKRLAELCLQALAEEPPPPNVLGTCFSIVRFGNVLGSSGSVIPLFKRQIGNGGPVTLTHPEITRYFMTIPEAAQLVIQAGGMAKGGEVFLLEMGDSVKIIDLARRMIHLSGLTEMTSDNPQGDIQIVFTGLRPGEKLYEELLIEPSQAAITKHPRIFQAKEPRLSMSTLLECFEALEELAIKRDKQGLKRLLSQFVLGYQPAQDQVRQSI